ncbi:MAG: LptF/LptG family permease [Hyphomonadaceae bacterium]|nr:LptF/LptG family permease [Hyphomonadaceae bacterium]
MISTLNRYIATKVMAGILIAFLIITSIIMLVDFVETSRDVGADANISMLTMLYLTLLRAPQLVEQTIPFVVLFGVMGALFALNKRAEIIVLRASGLSAWRFLKPAAIVTALLGLVWAIGFNPLAAEASKQHNITIKDLTADLSKDLAELQRIWLREGDDDSQMVIFAERADIRNYVLEDATFYDSDYDANGKPVFTLRYDAEKATLLREGYWRLSNVIKNQDGKLPQSFSVVSLPTVITRETLRSRVQTDKKPPFWKIRGEISKAKSAGFDATPLIMQFHKLLALPITLIAMATIAACASLNVAREGGTLRLLIIGAALGFGVYFTDNIISAFGETGALPPVLAAWSIPLLVLSGGIFFLSKIEDG